MSRRRWLLAIAILLGLTGIALARPGGGESYSGGGGHGGGGGGGGGDFFAILELIFWILQLCIEYPYLGLTLVGGFIVWIAYSAYKQHANKDWDSGPPAKLRAAVDLGDLRKLDPSFSQPVFEDFAFRLFSTAQRARGNPDSLATVAPYVAQSARDELAGRYPNNEPVEQVVIGAMRVVDLDMPTRKTDSAGHPNYVTIALQFEANLATKNVTQYSVETWELVRDAGRRTKPPAATRDFPCPNCGAPWQSTETGTQKCASCGQVVDNGRFDWTVQTITVDSVQDRPPTLTTDVPERGTDLPTYRQNDVEKRFERKVTGAEDRLTFETRLALIYTEINKAWSLGNLEPIRGLVSDGLYDYFQYWIDAYKKQGLRNALVDMRVTKTELAKVVRDSYYTAVTVRIWATGKDYVEREATGEVVRGSMRRERPYSEYWTLIRSAERTGPAMTDKRCGNCGAPLDITMAGACSHCGVHVTAGEFDWVLSKVEQDDSYRG